MLSSTFQSESQMVQAKKDLSHVVTQFGCVFKFLLALVAFKVEMTVKCLASEAGVIEQNKAGRTWRSKVRFYSLTKFSPWSSIGHSQGSVGG